MDNVIIKSQKIKLGKLFIFLSCILLVVLAVLIAVGFSKFQTYKEYQEVAVSATLGTTDQFDKYENNYNQMVKAMYDFYNPTYHSYTFNGKRYTNEEVMDTARDADEALGKLMTSLGYSCFSGSRYLKYTEFTEYFFNDWTDGVDTVRIPFEICGAILIVVLLLYLAYVTYRKELVIECDAILCKKGKKTVKQFMIRDVKSVQNKALNGIKIYGNGFKYGMILVKNRDEIQKTVMDKVAVLAEQAEQKMNTVSSGGSADEIKKYKELLDSGVITQEEFDAKKKQLLGL